MRIAVISDVHFPLHHKQAWNLTLSILPHLNIDKILLLGDIIDFEPLSRFSVPPDRRLQLQYEFDVAGKELLHLRKTLPNVPVEFKQGNHCARLNKFLYQKAPELFGLDKITVRGFLELDKLEIEWLKPEKPKREGRLLFLHGDEIAVGGQYPARNLYLKVSGNVFAGHFHRFDRYFHRLADGKVQASFINGCLRTLDPEWMMYNHWLLGFSIIDFSDGGFFHVEQIVMLKRGSSLWTSIGGKTYSSEIPTGKRK